MDATTANMGQASGAAGDIAFDELTHHNGDEVAPIPAVVSPRTKLPSGARNYLCPGAVTQGEAAQGLPLLPCAVRYRLLPVQIFLRGFF